MGIKTSKMDVPYVLATDPTGVIHTQVGELTSILNPHTKAVFESLKDGVYITDGSGLTLWANKAYESISGFKREEVIGKHVSDLVNEGYFNRSVVMQVLKSGQPQWNEQDYPRSGKVIEVMTMPLRDSTGRITHVVSTCRDITELRKATANLTRSEELRQRYRNELTQLRRRHGLDVPVYSSKKMEEVVELAGRVSRFDSTCLIEGETGVGKGVVARLVHDLSPRSNGPFIKVDCGAIPDSLLESELFGYEGGAFTDARREGKPGLVEVAAGGTLFLDEIGNLGVGVQSKLLGVLQDRQIKHVGGTRSIPVDVRVLAATREDLDLRVRSGRFREDLFYRLNVIRIRIPPLRERTEDIPPLILHFLKRLNDRYGTTVGISPDAVSALVTYPWPGNVRELENTIERALVLTREGVITTADLFLPEIPEANLEGKSLAEVVEIAERQAISRALQRWRTLESASRNLGIHRTTLLRKMRRLGLHT